VEQRVQLQLRSHRGLEPNPALVRQAEQRAQSIENRIADRITAFAGSMRSLPCALASRDRFPRSTSGGRPPTIVVVHDHAGVLELIEAALRDRGAHALVAALERDGNGHQSA
jgi:predicted LPLAT superfamily acyltransferase